MRLRLFWLYSEFATEFKSLNNAPAHLGFTLAAWAARGLHPTIGQRISDATTRWLTHKNEWNQLIKKLEREKGGVLYG